MYGSAGADARATLATLDCTLQFVIHLTVCLFIQLVGLHMEHGAPSASIAQVGEFGRGRAWCAHCGNVVGPLAPTDGPAFRRAP